MLSLTSPPSPSVKCHSSSPHLPTVAKARGETCSMSGLFHCGRIGDKLAGPLTASSEDVCFRFRKTCIWLPPPPLVLSFFTPCLQRSLPSGAILDSSHVQRTSKCAHDSRGQEKKKEKKYTLIWSKLELILSRKKFFVHFFICACLLNAEETSFGSAGQKIHGFFFFGRNWLPFQHARIHTHACTHTSTQIEYFKTFCGKLAQHYRTIEFYLFKFIYLALFSCSLDDFFP